MLIFAVFIVYPTINNFNISAYDSNNGRTFRYVGGRNYSELVDNAEFWAAARATALFAVCFVVLVTAASIGLAMLLDQRIRGRGLFRAVFFLPVLLSPVVVGLIWGWIFDRNNGLANTVLRGVGLGEPGWLINDKLAMTVVIFVALWTHVGFYTMIILAGLQGIDPTYHEAAMIDGASSWQRFRSVTLPLLRPTTMVVVILSMIAGFQAFDFIWTLTGGGPVGATTLMVQYIYQHAFESPIRYGLASAGSVVLFCTIFGLTALNFLYNHRKAAA
ncbi:sugar ABC transporter permease [Micromonospora globispora]|uniref:Sugar ABC transporter permease n=2 Tax=Micromonospora globispora TaxID=1450148 RepID=A0A317K3Y8_9ACTN|nr:sugar ABC transporter permease [Micromonospora globispora]PWU57002.1 sugar ABC transporter permease [Micromonospora globispora]RQW95492.1 sugar ABC transporter permease [Micromonospora globispora]